MMELYVEKDTDLMRSTFVAIGLGLLMKDLPPIGLFRKVRIMDVGSAYHIHVPYTREQALGFVRERGLPPLLPAIKKPPSEKERKALQAGASAEDIRRRYVPNGFRGVYVDYGKHKELADAEKKPKKGERQEGDSGQRHKDFPVWAHLCSYFGKGSAMRSVYPAILHTWHAHQGDAAEALLDLIVSSYAVFPNDTAAMRDAWEQTFLPALNYPDYLIKPTVTASSVVSPSTVQGVSRPSVADKLNNDSLEAFWLEMYLAFAGFMYTGMPYTMGSDVLLYYPIPNSILVDRLQTRMDAYRDSQETRRLYTFSNSLTRSKLDALAHIIFYQKMTAAFERDLENDEDDDEPEALSGLVGYYYRDNGGTQIPFDETLFALPPWLPRMPDAAQLAQARSILAKHYLLIDGLRGKPPRNQLTADELAILNDYRRFITMGEADTWIDFTISYGRYRFTNMVDINLPRLFIDEFEEMLMSIQNDREDYRPILENQGFRKVAAAIRHCTITTRYLKDVKKQQVGFKVRHGLGDDLRRRAQKADDFIEDLTAFLHDYARESISVEADTGKKRPRVSEQDLYEVITLVHNYGSRVVANLLIAVGYCAPLPKSAQPKHDQPQQN